MLSILFPGHLVVGAWNREVRWKSACGYGKESLKLSELEIDKRDEKANVSMEEKEPETLRA